MSEKFLILAIFLSYGPLALIILLYLAGLGLKLQGRPRLLATLVKMTSVPEPVKRRLPLQIETAPTPSEALKH